MIYASQEEAELGVAKWQQILRLGGWDIKVKIVRFEDMVPRGALAGVERYTNHQYALVRLCDPVDKNQYASEWPIDHEYDLVHELLHLHVEEIGDLVRRESKKLYRAIDQRKERLINHLARSLVELDRRAA